MRKKYICKNKKLAKLELCSHHILKKDPSAWLDGARSLQKYICKDAKINKKINK